MNKWLKPRTMFALMFYSAFIYLIVTGQSVPDILTNIVLMLLSYWFGQQTKKV